MEDYAKKQYATNSESNTHQTGNYQDLVPQTTSAKWAQGYESCFVVYEQ